MCPQAIRFDVARLRAPLRQGTQGTVCPLWPETVSLLKSAAPAAAESGDEPIFVNRYGEPLGASGVRFKLAQYVEAAAKHVPSLRFEARNAAQLPSCDGGASGRSGR